MYSVNLVSLALVKSPKRKIDFAPKINPIPDRNPTCKKRTISNRSIIPISIPASTREFFGLFTTSASDVHLLKKTLNIIGLTNTVNTIAKTYNRLFAENNVSQLTGKPYVYHTTATNDRICNV